eukprot:scaffold365348_cov66-Attheya_sp.AAC.1
MVPVDWLVVEVDSMVLVGVGMPEKVDQNQSDMGPFLGWRSGPAETADSGVWGGHEPVLLRYLGRPLPLLQPLLSPWCAATY